MENQKLNAMGIEEITNQKILEVFQQYGEFETYDEVETMIRSKLDDLTFSLIIEFIQDEQSKLQEAEKRVDELGRLRMVLESDKETFKKQWNSACQENTQLKERVKELEEGIEYIKEHSANPSLWIYNTCAELLTPKKQ